MTDLDEHGRPEPPLAAGETATLLSFLEYQRATFAWKCGGLDAAGLNKGAPPRHVGHADLLREAVDGDQRVGGLRR